jgi:DNA-directed RNA polymerase specialized sigma subunit
MKNTKKRNIQIFTLNEDELNVVWCAMAAMVKDIHAPQDMMNDDDWEVAEQLWQRVEKKVFSKHKRVERERMTESRIDVIREDLKKGLKLKEIAGHIGVSPARVSQLINQYDLRLDVYNDIKRAERI